MMQLVWIAAGCLGTGLVAALAFGYALEIFAGMFGPLVASGATWIAIERTYRRDPARVSGVLMRAFGAKMLFFGAYVVLAVRVLALDVVPFAAAFAAFFLGLQAVVASLARGLMAPQAS
jgi:hypothetical protein